MLSIMSKLKSHEFFEELPIVYGYGLNAHTLVISVLY
jgi:hypothetical protein